MAFLERYLQNSPLKEKKGVQVVPPEVQEEFYRRIIQPLYVLKRVNIKC